MTIEIKTATIEPIRSTFANLQRRFGDKPASRYQEATYDVQAETNFHYRPLWQPDRLLNDKRRTAVVMEDWYSLKDPRQFYYGSYVQQRARMQEQAENNYAFFEKRDLARHLSDDARNSLIRHLVPLRHVEHTANLNNVYGSAYGYGTAVTQAMLFDGMDRLGIAQYLSRIGLILDGNTGESLSAAKQSWMQDSCWQGMRAMCEKSLTVEDWFETFVLQDLVIDTLMQELFYVRFDQWLSEHGGQDVGMLTEFMRDWYKDTSRWVDAVLKEAVSESAANQQLIQGWFGNWRGRVVEALAPVVADMNIDDAALDIALQTLDKRAAKVGL
ncbi:aromatic/alkene monooxygenase hydroxylase subunit beta [Oceanobacter mangrovi]|uniref:aromatic/alkene monooxygenase hydroxylase subunit beta n=1 Tax=Oceanobacter mangrovi TaxID=2862510 RepID=UPI001C8DE6E1|nr:aromatic/alkene monooxygenase hydroxylase subunit beta [Oceanobacter mangrovi]